ncbi:LytTR family DNA-binding domain-containing protein [Pedobacter nyackensis]|uniref:LytR/AlgR family response regulator transcription factor n=1 Tax=Pedobacter nyackensis TaxID=475255 RepID=UPI00292D3BBA|nr:LytTR family DNA-binding domain-containing protein [Pedobacter nyackensis]
MDGKLNCIVIDDEKHAVELLVDYIDILPNLNLIKSFTDPLSALMNISLEDNTDVIFIDVDMPGMTGIDLALALRHKTRYLVFTSAHSRYAIDAFGVQANEYLLKPISMSKFALMIDRLIKLDEAIKKEADKEDYFFIKTDQVQKYIKVNLKDLVAIEGLNNYVKIHTVAGMHIAYLTMKELEAKLEGNDSFIRVQRSFIISTDFINKVEGAFITLNNKLEVPLGTTYKKHFFSFLDKKTLRSNRGISE